LNSLCQVLDDDFVSSAAFTSVNGDNDHSFTLLPTKLPSIYSTV